MTEANEERTTGTAGNGGDVPGAEPDANAVPLAVAPGGMGSGSALPIVAPAALDDQGAAGGGPDGGGNPDREAFNSGEDEVGGSGGPVGGTARP
jgi:hypothetical protein